MAGRLKASVFVACCLLAGPSASAQELLSAGYPSSAPDVAAAGYGGECCNGPGAGPSYSPYGMVPAAMVEGGVGYLDQDCVVATRGIEYDDDLAKSPLEKLLERAVENTWVRVEYVHYHYQQPGGEILGNDRTLASDDELTFFDTTTPPPRPVLDPRVPFTFIDPASGIPHQFRALDLKRIGLKDNPGIRGTLGLPLTFGTLETSAFAVQHDSESFSDERLPGVTDLPVFVPNAPPFPFFDFVTFVGTQPATLNGATSDILIPYETGLAVLYESEIWGTESNLVFNSVVPHERFGLLPIVGFRYLNVFEEMTQRGENSGQFTTIASSVHNRVFGPQFGLRAQTENPHWTIGVEGKVALAANKYRANVAVLNLPDVYGPNLQPVANRDLATQEEDTTFSPIGEFTVFGRINVNDHLTLFVSYDLVASAKITRPFDNIAYNFMGVQNNLVNDIHVDAEHRSFRFEGWTAGGEIRWK